MTAAERIKAARAKTGLSQKRFAELLHVTKRNVERWETDDRTPPEYVVFLIEYWVAHEFR